MNPLLGRLQTIRAKINDICKLYKHWHSSPTKLRNTTEFIHEAPLSVKKMWLNNPQFHNPFCSAAKTDVSYEYRFWKKICFDKPQTPGLQFKIISFNILAQDLLCEHPELYTRSNKKCLKWNDRLHQLTKKMVEQQPDILCLQEVQENHLADIMTIINPQLPSMSYVFKKKTGTRTDGCAIIYNTNLFELILSDYVEFYQPEIQLLDRHNIALFAKFKCKSQKEANILISTTHLLFNPNRQDVRLAQIMVLLAELDRHSIVKPGKLRRMPVILTGDFNFQPNSAPFQLITTGKLYYESLEKKSLTLLEKIGSLPIGKSFISDRWQITDNCQYIDCVKSKYKNIPQKIQRDHSPTDAELFSTGTLSHGLHLQSAYNHFDGISYGSIFMGSWITIDHLFYSQDDTKKLKLKNGSLKLLSILKLPTVNQCKRIGPLPNEDNGSDHLMLAARFFLEFPVTNQ